MTKNRIDNRALAQILKRFDQHLTCWQVTRALGSIVIFDMGQTLPVHLRSGETTIIGSMSLTLEGDDWIIQKHGEDLFDSENLAAGDVPTINAAFLGRKLLTASYNRKATECCIKFTDDLEIKLFANAEDGDLCVFAFPDGTLIGCDASSGFGSDGSRSEERAAAYASVKANSA